MRKLQEMQCSLVAEKPYSFEDRSKWLSATEMLRILDILDQQCLLWLQYPNASLFCTNTITIEAFKKLNWDRADIVYDFTRQHYSIIRYESNEQASIMAFIENEL